MNNDSDETAESGSQQNATKTIDYLNNNSNNRQQREFKEDDFYGALFDQCAMEESADELDDIYYKMHAISYGDLRDNYDRERSITQIATTSIQLQREVENRIQQQSQQLAAASSQLAHALSTHKIPTQTKSIDPRTLNLTCRRSLINVIEWNREHNKIFCPFDELAFFKLSDSCYKPRRKFSEFQTNWRRLSANCVNCDVLFKKVSESELKLYDTSSFLAESSIEMSSPMRNVEENNSTICQLLLPLCVASYLKPFFFDIFEPSELKHLSNKSIDILLTLKNNFEPTTHWDRSSRSILQSAAENILWNCFALFKYHVPNIFQIFYLYFIFWICIKNVFIFQIPIISTTRPTRPVSSTIWLLLFAW